MCAVNQHLMKLNELIISCVNGSYCRIASNWSVIPNFLLEFPKNVSVQYKDPHISKMISNYIEEISPLEKLWSLESLSVPLMNMTTLGLIELPSSVSQKSHSIKTKKGVQK